MAPQPGPPSSTPGAPSMPLTQKMAVSFKSLLDRAKRLAIGGEAPATTGPAPMDRLFAKVDPALDGADCLNDCDTCSVHYPRNFKIEEDDVLYGHVKPWMTHLLVATCKSDWVRDVADEKGSVMQAIDKAEKPSNGRLMLSASNMPTPNHTTDYSEPTTVLLLPAFVLIDDVTPSNVPDLLKNYVNAAPTALSPLAPLSLPQRVPLSPPATSLPDPASAPLTDPSPPTTTIPPLLSSRPCPHAAVILLCSQRTRDARCGQSAPLLRKELERHLRALGLHRDLDDDRPGGVGVYFISHVGGHKYSANVMVYRRPDAFGVDGATRGDAGDDLKPVKRPARKKIRVEKSAEAAAAEAEAANGAGAGEVVKEGDEEGSSADKKAAETGEDGEEDEPDVGAAQCIWLARVRPEDCEGLVKFTVLQGKVIKPERQLRGGYDRAKGLMSW